MAGPSTMVCAIGISLALLVGFAHGTKAANDAGFFSY